MEFQFSLFHSTTYNGTRGTSRRPNILIFPYIQYSCRGQESKLGERTVWLNFEIKKHNFLNVIINWRHDFIENDFVIYLMPWILI